MLVSFLIEACSEGSAKKRKAIDQGVKNIQDKMQNKGSAQKACEKIDDAIGNQWLHILE